ncbi:MAG: hypothetical protein PHR00_00870 [Patescibacteria group bacterium]|nr:hypothetical protein [Patescibacteria group bacterium]
MPGLFGINCDNFAFAYSLSWDDGKPSLVIKIDDSLAKRLEAESFGHSTGFNKIIELKKGQGYIEASIPFIQENVAAIIIILENFFNKSRDILPIKKGDGTQLLLLNLHQNPKNFLLPKSQIEGYLNSQLIRFIKHNLQNGILEKTITEIVSQTSQALDGKKRKVTLTKNYSDDFHLLWDNKNILCAKNVRHAVNNHTGCSIKSYDRLSDSEMLIAISVLAKLSDCTSKK